MRWNCVVRAALAGFAVLLAVPAAAADPEPGGPVQPWAADLAGILPADRDFPPGWKVERDMGWTIYRDTPGSDSSDDGADVEAEPEGCDPSEVLAGPRNAPTSVSVEGRSPGDGASAGLGDEVEARIVASPDASDLFDAFADFAARCPRFRVAQGARPSAGEREGSADGSFMAASAPPETADGALALSLRMRVVWSQGRSEVVEAAAEAQIAMVRGLLVVVTGAHFGSSEDGGAGVALSRKLFAQTVRRLHNAP